MRSSASLQLLISLFLCASCAHGIMVKFGTNEGPIVPPTPEPELPAPQPYRAPAPVWEARASDSPDPNAQWRPQLFKPQPRYTQVVFNLPPLSLNNAQRFVNSYLPTNSPPVKAEVPTNYFTPSQILSSQHIPGFGVRYFVPEYINNSQKRAERDGWGNAVENNEVEEDGDDSGSEKHWKREKDSAKRLSRQTAEGSGYVPVYIWPAYVPRAHQ